MQNFHDFILLLRCFLYTFFMFFCFFVLEKYFCKKNKKFKTDLMTSFILLLMMPCFRSIDPKVFLWKGVLKIWSKFTGEHPCRSVILIKLQSNFIEITLRHGCSPVKLLHISRTPFPRNASGWPLLPLRSSREVWRRLQAIMIDNGQYCCRVKKMNPSRKMRKTDDGKYCCRVKTWVHLWLNRGQLLYHKNLYHKTRSILIYITQFCKSKC